jgi:hypothetical protein
MSNDLEMLVSVYIKIRTEREHLLLKYEEEDASLKKDLAQLEVALLSVCNDVNANSINTQYGTVIRKLNERFYCNDWDNFRKFVRENDAVELLERRIHQGNFKQFLSAHKDEGLPPGVNVMREFGVTVRKSNSSTQ